MSAVGSSADSSSICAAIRFAISSSTCCPSTTIRCCSSRSYTESDSVMDAGAERRMVTAPPRRIPAVVSCWLTSPCLLWSSTPGCSTPVCPVHFEFDPTRTVPSPTAHGAVVRCRQYGRPAAPDTSRRGGRRPAALGRRGALVRRRLRLGRTGAVGRRESSSASSVSAASWAVSTAAGSASEAPSVVGVVRLDVVRSSSSAVVAVRGADQVRHVDGRARLVGDRRRRDGRDQRLAAPHVRVDRAELARPPGSAGRTPPAASGTAAPGR